MNPTNNTGAPQGAPASPHWTAQPCEWEGTKIIEQGEQVAAISMATPEALALMLAASEMYAALRCALADLEGIMPEFEPSGERTHPAWTTITEARAAIEAAEDSAPWKAANEFDKEAGA